jgi:hypothetical protein
MDPIEVLGIGSAFMILYAFTANEYGWLPVRSMTYDMLNLGGSVGLFIYAFNTGVFPFMLTNAVWGAVAGLDVIKHLRKQKNRAIMRAYMRMFRRSLGFR